MEIRTDSIDGASPYRGDLETPDLSQKTVSSGITGSDQPFSQEQVLEEIAEQSSSSESS